MEEALLGSEFISDIERYVDHISIEKIVHDDYVRSLNYHFNSDLIARLTIDTKPNIVKYRLTLYYHNQGLEYFITMYGVDDYSYTLSLKSNVEITSHEANWLKPFNLEKSYFDLKLSPNLNVFSIYYSNHRIVCKSVENLLEVERQNGCEILFVIYEGNLNLLLPDHIEMMKLLFKQLIIIFHRDMMITKDNELIVGRKMTCSIRFSIIRHLRGVKNIKSSRNLARSIAN
jgi:hypothetical protein